MAVFVIDLIAMVAGLPRALFPETAEKSFHAGPARGAMIVGVVIWGVGITGFGLSALLGSGGGGLVLAVFFLAIAGVGDLHHDSADRHRRCPRPAPSLFNVTVAGGQRLGDFSHGITAALVGAIAVSGGGVLVVLAAILLLLAIPITYRYRFDPTRPTDEPAALDRESVPTKELSGPCLRAGAGHWRILLT
ncbi:hypothetical protein BOX37_17330 [Nocardia mangyaensis]|uniref:Uncharacterized protein n=1 Tax=Nocardia mangyaensis TaxID=2213200 RepID=A0A1J0VTR9_9NOCA|nr:hypothetical protein [Nocardia mangyaensis]APE35417.1 hypothetical protein BOX37_17330 [Nocardia mangyaensis]